LGLGTDEEGAGNVQYSTLMFNEESVNTKNKNIPKNRDAFVNLQPFFYGNI